MGARLQASIYIKKKKLRANIETFSRVCLRVCGERYARDASRVVIGLRHGQCHSPLNRASLQPRKASAVHILYD